MGWFGLTQALVRAMVDAGAIRDETGSIVYGGEPLAFGYAAEEVVIPDGAWFLCRARRDEKGGLVAHPTGELEVRVSMVELMRDKTGGVQVGVIMAESKGGDADA